MVLHMHIVFILILSLTRIEAQLNLYHTDRVNETDFYYDCLYYKLFDSNLKYRRYQKDFQNPYQLIPYCQRPLAAGRENITMSKGNISSPLTFEELSKQRVNVQDLIRWSAPIDLIERYQNSLNMQNSSLTLEIFYNCTPPWFGPVCQYTFDSTGLFSSEGLLDSSKDSFSDIVDDLHDAKFRYQFTRYGIILNITNWTCYIHVECNRAQAPFCLDWREICDGKVDCLGDGIDEINCSQLETNECEENEYRCHNGMCIPQQFVNDARYNPDCLDRADENDDVVKDISHGGIEFGSCYEDPTFRCEELNYFSIDQCFACGNGEISRLPFPIILTNGGLNFVCTNHRDKILRMSLLLDANRSNLTDKCWFLMNCLTEALSNIPCSELLCEGQGSCSLSIVNHCNLSHYVILPVLPIFEGHVQLGYWTNRTIIYSFRNPRPFPDFVCYDIQRCPFLLPNLAIDNLTCVDMQNINVVDFKQLNELFHTCLPIDKNGNETDCFDSSLFHCPNTSKCISKHRLLDGIVDCYGGADETFTDSCNLNDTYRFRCSSEDKCISPILVVDGTNHCREGEDDIRSFQKEIHFQNLCNGFIHNHPVLINEQYETDETNCEQWPCVNQYTRCDIAWTCPNGADEINCDPLLPCYPDRHECMSPTTFQRICLPMDRAGDGNVDCLGATDERQYCRNLNPFGETFFYRCWNDSKCVDALCPDGIRHCLFEQKFFSSEEQCDNYPEINDLIGMFSDVRLASMYVGDLNFKRVISSYIYRYFYFTLDSSKRLTTAQKALPLPIEHNDDNYLSSSVKFYQATKLSDLEIVLQKTRRIFVCNRGVLIYIGIDKMERCLCPPSYYGNRCQFQNERVSLTIQFEKECAFNCRGVYIIFLALIDNDQLIHSHDQLTYVPTYTPTGNPSPLSNIRRLYIQTERCNLKYNIYFLYLSRPKDLTKNYSIHIHAYNKIDLSYHASWILPIKFLFLPVNRVAAYLKMPAHPVDVLDTCQLDCGVHGHCAMYLNKGKYFCRCDSGWSGFDCRIREDKCDCSSDSICLGVVNNRSICLCSIDKSSPRCFIRSVCQNDTCKNDGQCIPEDGWWSMNSFICICAPGYSGKTCEVNDTRIDISFDDIEIPQSLLIHLITVQSEDHPRITAVSKKIALDEDMTTLNTSELINLIFVQINTEYHLVFRQVNATPLAHIQIKMKSSEQCSPIHQLLDQRTMAFALLRRAKYYHIPCGEQPQLTCFYDNEAFMCLCNADRHANCFSFPFNRKPNCQGWTRCDNGGTCIQDRPTCPMSTMCVCPDCYYGGKCQFTMEGLSPSLDVILKYQIRPHLRIVDQPAAVKVGIGIMTLLLLIGLINGILSTITFQSRNLRKIGCGIYLFASSIISLLCTVVFTLRFWLLILSQISLITNHHFLMGNCIVIEFILRSILAIGDWLSACVAVERILTVIKGLNFNIKKSRQFARWIIVGVVIFTFLSILHDPIYRELINDDEEQRKWCVVRYPPTLKIFDSIMHLFHFLMPFFINFISAIIVIVTAARTHWHARKQQAYGQHLKDELKKQKHLIISPLILIILATPRLVISFRSGCKISVRNPWLFLFGYFISFTPPMLTSLIFIWPSQIYRKELNRIIRRQRLRFK